VSAAPRPGWYPDPAGTPELYRWWDGGDWTEAISESPRAPSPRLHSPARPEDALERRRPSRFRSVVALLVCLALFLSATIGLGLVIWQDGPGVQRTGRGPLAAPTGPVGATPEVTGVGRLDQRTRVATLGAASMSLPTEPYVLSSSPMSAEGLEVFFLASAPVHLRYDGRRSWFAAVLLARLVPDPGGADLSVRGQRALEQLSRTMFSGHPTRLEPLSADDHAVDGNAGLVLRARVHYEVDRLPSRYDDLTVLLVQLPDGATVVAVSSVPDDADPAVVGLAAQALDTLAVS
jgi:hypothetical protein